MPLITVKYDDGKRVSQMNGFRYTSYAQEIIFGPGSLARLDEAVEGFHWQRLLLCSTGTLQRDGTIASLEEALAKRLVAVYDHVQPHIPDFQVVEATALAHENEVDAVIGLGGGSAIGMAKAVSLSLEEKRKGQADGRSEEHTSELQSQSNLVCRLLLEKKYYYSVHVSNSVRLCIAL